MANAQVATLGLILLALGVLGYFIPVPPTPFTIPQVNDACDSGMGQLGQTFSGDLQKICREYGYLMYGVYGSVIIGIILMIIGAVTSGGAKEVEYHREVKETKEEDDSMEILKKRYAKGEISNEEFEKMKKDLNN